MASECKIDRIESYLGQAIRGGQYLPGDRLPTEHELARQWEVARGTVQQALRRLVEEGLVKRVKGSGTYVLGPPRKGMTVYAPIINEAKITSKHLWAKLIEFADGWHEPVQLQRRVLSQEYDPQAIFDLAVKVMGGQTPAGFFLVPATRLGRFMDAELCADVTETVQAWSARHRVEAVALEAVRRGSRSYGIPLQGTLSCLAHHPQWLEAAGLDAGQAAGSLEGFMRAVAALKRSGRHEHPLWVADTRVLVTHVLRAFYADLSSVFANGGTEPLDAQPALAVLETVHRLRWEYDADIEFSGRFGSGRWQSFIGDFSRGRIPMAITDLLPRGCFDPTGTGNVPQPEFTPLSFGAGGRPFSFFNAVVAVINPRLDDAARQFFASFFAAYAQPDTQRELDARYIEEGRVGPHNDVFVDSQARIPADGEYQRARAAIYACAEMELPRSLRGLNELVAAADRLVLDRDTHPQREYQVYRDRFAVHASNRTSGAWGWELAAAAQS